MRSNWGGIEGKPMVKKMSLQASQFWFLVIGFASFVCFLIQACASTSGETQPSKTVPRAASATPTRRFVPSRTPMADRSAITLTGCLEDSSSINIRACGGTEFEVVGYLMKDDCKAVIGRDADNQWVLLEKGGWVNAFYLVVDGETKNLPITTCDGKVSKATQQATTGAKPSQTRQPTVLAYPTNTQKPVGGNCDPAYPTVCIPSPPPDLDCGQIQYRNFKVLPPDPHNFDGNHDGIGCEQ